MRKIDKIIIHCSYSDIPSHDNIETIRKWHVDENGWSDVGYHYFITSDGTVQNGRPLESAGAHTIGQNHDSIGICLHGKSKFTFAQFTTLKRLILKLQFQFQIPDEKVFGHRDFTKYKTCPVFDYKKVLSIDWDSRPLNEWNEIYNPDDFI